MSESVFLAAIPPFLPKTSDNPTSVDSSVFDGVKAGIGKDSPAFPLAFLTSLFNGDILGGDRTSGELVRHSCNIADGASPITSWHAPRPG
ncbi:MAG: hypothetical protein AB7P40_16050 [Chloroflexota bacterium]